jgi:hypothetical protein
MSNLAGKAYAMTVLTPLKRGQGWIQGLIYRAGRALPSQLAGLMGLSLIHFARWVIIRPQDWPDLGQGPQPLQHDYLLFCSNFNGTWDQYIDAFSDGIPQGLDLFWYASADYPHSLPITPFKDYIVHNQIDTNYYYNATPGASQRDIKAALRVMREVRRLAALHAGQSPARFALEFRATLRAVQGDLGSRGPAPVASLDAEHAAARLRGRHRN